MDLQVRLAELSVTGSLRSTKKLAQHRGPAHKMTLLPDSPYIVLSAGEDGQVLSWHWSWAIYVSLQVLSIDIREPKPDKILLLRNEKDKKVCMAMDKTLKGLIPFSRYQYTASTLPPPTPTYSAPLAGQMSVPLTSTSSSFASRDQFIRVFDRRYLGLEARGGGQVVPNLMTWI